MQTNNQMQKIANEIRGLTLECIASIGQGHIGGSLSIVDVLTVLYYHEMNIDPKDPKKEGRDRLVVSKGHAGPAVYATLAHRGYFDKKELKTLNKIGTLLPSHCDMNKTVGIDMTTGSLGQGLSCAVGMSLASKMKKDGAYIYCIIGDGESQEGQIWEASMYAAQKKLNNLIVFLDNNKMQIDNYTENENSLISPKDKWESFGFFAQSVDGHNFNEIINAIDLAKKQDKPAMIVLNTIKGKGLTFVEQAGLGCHSMPISKEQLAEGLQQLGQQSED
jgi:transketolase